MKEDYNELVVWMTHKQFDNQYNKSAQDIYNMTLRLSNWARVMKLPLKKPLS